jgi:outer membrane protein TolC
MTRNRLPHGCGFVTAFLSRVRKPATVALSLAALAWAQDIQPLRPQAPVIVRSYLPVTVPPIRLANSERLWHLVRAGMLYLTTQDTIALVLENNIDIEVSRYNPFISEWQLERAQAGGALPGVPNGASQAGSVATGQGVSGSQAAAGVTAPGASSTTGRTANATISQIGPVTPNLDPIVQETTSFSHTSSPQPDSVQSRVLNLIQGTRVVTGSYQQGLISGGVATVSYSKHYLNENAPTDVLNPSIATSLSASIQYNFLRGFGVASNARTITVARMNLNITELNFKNQVIGLVSQALNLYYGLAADYEDLRAKRNVSNTAQTLLKDVKRQIEIGSSAPSDLIAAESQVFSSAQAVAAADATLRQQELSLKNLISRTGATDPALADVAIVPVDSIAIPATDNLLPIGQMTRQALISRPDLAAELANEQASEVNTLGTKNGILPTLQGVAVQNQAGLAGRPMPVKLCPPIAGPGQPPIAGPGQPVPTCPIETADPRFQGGIGTALGQVFRRDFATDIVGAFYQAPIRNRQAQADYSIDLLQLRQTLLTNRKDINQVEVDVRSGVVALQQARARIDAALKNRALQQELYDGEQKRFRLGASTPYNVALQQRDLISAQSAVVAAMIAYSTARVTLDQTLGITLETNHITMDEAKTVKVSRVSSLP